MSDERKPGDKPRTITVDIDTLNELIASRVKEQVAAAAAGTLDAQAQFQAQLDEFRGKNRKTDIVEVFHDCESPLTGATFRARCLVSKSMPVGRVVDLADYTFPPHVGEYVAPTGADGEAIRVSKERFEHNKFVEYWQKDLNAFAGSKPFTKMLLKSEADRRRAEDSAK